MFDRSDLFIIRDTRLVYYLLGLILGLEQGEPIYGNMRCWEQRVVEPDPINEDHREEEYQRQETKSVSEMKLWDLELRN